jgi:hypothetical protein
MIFANENPPQETKEEHHHAQIMGDDYHLFKHRQPRHSEEEGCCDDDSIPYQTMRCCKAPRHFCVEKRRLVPQNYCVNVWREETEYFEGEDCHGCKVKCAQKVPHHYQIEKTRYVPASCHDEVTRYGKQHYLEDDYPHCLQNERSESYLSKFMPCWLEATFDTDVGIRRDSLSCTINHFDPPGFFLSTDTLNIDGIQVIEAGIKAKAIAFKAFMVRGSFYAGGISGGRYKETVLGNTGQSVTFKAKARGGDTMDASIGGGILFPVACGVRVGPTAGWSYNSQRVKMKSSNPIFNKLQYKNRWQGGWLGADALVTFCKFGLHAGYEYHNPNWQAAWLMNIPDTVGGAFSDVRNSKNGFGNVVFLEAYTVRLGCLRLNCQVKYQHWKMRSGSSHPKFASFADLGYGADEVDKIPRATWQSLEAIIGLGLDF